jgi:uroporphyrinogen-III synthase
MRYLAAEYINSQSCDRRLCSFCAPPLVQLRHMSFRGARVLSFESRRATEMAELIRLNGGDPFVAPALVEVPLENNEVAFEFSRRLYAGEFEMMIFLTGVGARLLSRVLATREPAERLVEALRSLTVVARGPKPMAVMREWAVPVAVAVPEPNTWRQVLNAVQPRPEKSVAVQEYGRPSLELTGGLVAQGRTVSAVTVYQWALPPDTTLLAEGLARLLADQVDVVLFTTSVQLEHLLQFAAERGQRETAIAALSHTFVASIGPTCTETLRQHGLSPAMEPTYPKIGILAREAAAAFSAQSAL